MALKQNHFKHTILLSGVVIFVILFVFLAFSPKFGARFTPPSSVTSPGAPPSLNVVPGVLRAPYLQRPQEGMTLVVWLTDSGEPGEVRYGLAPGSGERKYTAPRFDASLNGYVHEVILPDLSPGVRHYYKVFWNNQLVTDSFYDPTKQPGQQFSFIVFGDSGYGGGNPSSPQMQLAQAMQTEYDSSNFDFILHTGDVVYPNGEQANYASNFFTPYSYLLSHVPAFAVLGQIDGRTDKGAPFFTNFYLPKNSEEGEQYYSFEHGDALFVGIDSVTTDYAVGSPQFSYAVDALLSSDKPWKFISFNHPVFLSENNVLSQSLTSANLVPLFSFLGVHAVFNGNQRYYARFKESNGVTTFVTGGGGAPLQTPPALPDIAKSVSNYHFLRVDVATDLLSFKAVDSRGNVIDSGSVAPKERLLSFNEGMLAGNYRHPLYPYYPAFVLARYVDKNNKVIPDATCSIKTNKGTSPMSYATDVVLYGGLFNGDAYIGHVTTDKKEGFSYEVTCSKSGYATLKTYGWIEFNADYPGISQAPFGQQTGSYHIENLGGRDWVVNPMGQRVYLSGMGLANPAYFNDDYYEANYANEKEFAVEAFTKFKEMNLNVLGHKSAITSLRGYYPYTYVIPSLEFGEQDTDIWSPEWLAKLDSDAQDFANIYGKDSLLVGYWVADEPLNSIESGHSYKWVRNMVDNINSLDQPMPYAKQAFVDALKEYYAQSYPGQELAKLNLHYDLDANPTQCNSLTEFTDFQQLYDLDWLCLYPDLYRNGKPYYRGPYARQRFDDLQYFNKMLVRQLMTKTQEALDKYLERDILNLGYKVAVNIDNGAMEEMMKYADVFSIDLYLRLDGELGKDFDKYFRQKMEDWHTRSGGKPILIAELSYVHKDWDSCGGESYPPAESQAQRVDYYKKYQDTALTYPYVVGTIWYGYMDVWNSPERMAEECTGAEEYYMNFGVRASDDYSSYQTLYPNAPWDSNNLPDENGFWSGLVDGIKVYNSDLQQRAGSQVQ